MQIKASRGSNWGSDGFVSPDVALELRFSGSGALDNPFLITSKNFWLNKFFQLDISNSNSYIKIKSIALKALYLRNCENITISDVNIKHLGLGNCSRISIERVKIQRHLKLSNVTQIKIVECNIGKLFAFSGERISIFYSDIKKISRKSQAKFRIQDNYKTPISVIKAEKFKENPNQNPNFWLCTQCGSEVDMYSRFCHDCGFRLN